MDSELMLAMDDSIDSGSGQLASKMQGLAHTIGDKPAGATTARSMNNKTMFNSNTIHYCTVDDAA